MEEENKDLEKIISDVLKPKLQEQFMLGVKTGWVGALQTIDTLTKDLHNVKEIRKVIRNKIEEYTKVKDEVLENDDTIHTI